MKLISSSKNSQIFLQLVADVIAIWMGFAVQLHLRFFSGIIETFAIPNFVDYVFGSVMMTGFWLLIFSMFGMYKNWFVSSPFKEFYALVKTSFFGCLVIVFLLLADSSSSFRTLFLAYFGISVLSFGIFRFIARRIQIKLRRNGIIKIPTLIIGKLKPSIEFYIDTLKAKSWGYDIQGIVLYDKEELDDKDKKRLVAKMHDTTSKSPFSSIGTTNEYYTAEEDFDKNMNSLIRGTMSKINDIIEHISVEEIVLSSGTPDSKLLFEIENICQRKNLRLSVFPNLYDHFTGRTRTKIYMEFL